MAQPRSPPEVFLALASATARSSAPATTTTISPRLGPGRGPARRTLRSPQRAGSRPRPDRRGNLTARAYGLEVITPCHGPQVSRVIVPTRHLPERFLPTTPAQTPAPAEWLRLAEQSSARSPAGERG